MRIAIATDWFPPRLGGIESQLQQLGARLARGGHTVDVLTSTPGAVDADGYRVRSLSHLTVAGLDLALSPGLTGALRAELGRGYDVLHAHVSVVSPLGYAAVAVGQSLGLPTVVTFHSVLRHKRLLLQAANALLRLTDYPIVWTGVSELIASQLRSSFGDADVSVLPNGVDLAFWRAAASTRNVNTPITFVSATRLHRKKRPAALLGAFASAAACVDRPTRLLLAGDGPERRTIARAIRDRGLDEGRARVELLGWQTADALRSLYASADAFVLASKRESFGIAALEAVATGLPVIAMRESGCREFVGNGTGGYLCDDDAELASALTSVMTASVRRSAGTPTHLARYDWPAVIAVHEATYDRAIRQAAGAIRPA